MRFLAVSGLCQLSGTLDIQQEGESLAAADGIGSADGKEKN